MKEMALRKASERQTDRTWTFQRCYSKLKEGSKQKPKVRKRKGLGNLVG